MSPPDTAAPPAYGPPALPRPMLPAGSHLLRLAPNPSGRDLAVGDIHGHFSKLRDALARVGFDGARDRLLSVGDLIDRGPESERALEWLAQPWFHAVRGNHEDYPVRLVRTGLVDRENYARNGGGWFLALPPEAQARHAAAYAQLPYALSVPTPQGEVGIIHAASPSRDWQRVAQALTLRSARGLATWSRRKAQEGDTTPIAGVRAVVVGHQPMADPLVLGNVHYIDTAGWTPEGRFTLLDLATLQPV
ncbi:Ren protein [plant metagenome]|uniref:Ren protein n=2 Tax=root TaxID=1 RepID=A0A1C3K1M1_9BURK|nr:Ren protein [Orrella dioscoreae]SOE48904.1 Ren protein [Orrella dioscoreae]